MEILTDYYYNFMNYIHYIQDYIVTSQFLLPLDEIMYNNEETEKKFDHFNTLYE